jgi:hypothetical protein
MENDDIFLTELDNIHYFKNGLLMCKNINNNCSLCLNDRGFYIYEIDKKNKDNNIMKFFMYVEGNSVVRYEYDRNIIMDSDDEIYFGFECDDFVRKIGKIGKPTVGILSIQTENENNNNGRIKLILKQDRGNPQANYIDIFHTDIKDRDEIPNKYKGVKFNLKIANTDFSKFCEKILQCKCDSVIIRAYEKSMDICGMKGNRLETEDSFGTFVPNFIIDEDAINYPICYKISEEKLSFLSKVKTLSVNTKLKFFFFRKKLVIKSKLSSIGGVIIEFDYNVE